LLNELSDETNLEQIWNFESSILYIYIYIYIYKSLTSVLVAISFLYDFEIIRQLYNNNKKMYNYFYRIKYSSLIRYS
jgi:hypothetical protein